jgi:hypothetical protein
MRLLELLVWSRCLLALVVRGAPGGTKELNTRPIIGKCLALCLRLLLGDIGFVYPVMSMMVIGPSLPILRQRWWSLMYDVY